MGSSVTERVPCPLCGAADGLVPFLEKDGFAIVRCRACGLVHVNPRPTRDTLGALYQDPTYFGGGEWYDDYLGDAENHRRLFRRIVDLLGRFAPDRGRLLDVGCAAGFLLEVARERGWTVTGIEPSTAMAEDARRTLAVEVQSGTLESVTLPAASFDAVTLCDSIEHMADPRAALAEVRRLLVPGGIVLVVTPNVASVAARLMGARWPHYTPREHVLYFDPATLAGLFERVGFRTIHRQSIGHRFRIDAILRKLVPAATAAHAARALGPFARRSVALNVGDLLMIGRAEDQRGRATNSTAG